MATQTDIPTSPYFLMRMHSYMRSQMLALLMRSQRFSYPLAKIYMLSLTSLKTIRHHMHIIFMIKILMHHL